jgi:hypothetical protein
MNKIESVEETPSHKRQRLENDISKGGGQQCPYLDTVNRMRLDFDFEKLCSVSLTHSNVYACLVCGRYYQGLLSGYPGFLIVSFQVEAHHLMRIITACTKIITFSSISLHFA